MVGEVEPSRVLVVEPNDYFFRDIIKPKLVRGGYREEEVRRFVNFWDLFNYLFSIKQNKPEIVICSLPFREYRDGADATQKSLEEEGLERAFKLCDPKSWIINIGQIYVYTSEKNPSYKSRVFATKVLGVVRELFDGASFARDDRHLEELLKSQTALLVP